MSQAVLEQLQAKFPNAVRETHNFRGDETVVITRESLVAICRWLKETPELDCNMIMDVCGVDFPERAERFEVVYHIYSTTKRHRIRLKVRLNANDAVVDSVMSVWIGANWFERETFDMFGIHFTGHPQMKRLLTFEGFEGHPLRKDYPVNKRPKIPTPDPMMS